MVRSLAPWQSRGTSLFDTLRREMDDLVGHGCELDESRATFLPRTNIAETDQNFELTVDLPGIRAEDVKVEFHEGNLTISGTRKHESEEKGKTYHRVERSYGEFRRSFILGPDVDSERVEAEYSDGVLNVVVPKAEKAQPKRIEIKS